MLPFIVASLSLATEPASVHHERVEQIRMIEATEGVLWRAAPHPRFSSSAPGASASMNGVKNDWKKEILAGVAAGEIHEFSPSSNAAVPTSFDSETAFPQCAKVIGDIRDQSNCGCCWAFAGAEAASDRMCISSNATLKLALSAQDVCFCSSFNGCGGGMISTPWNFIKKKGAVTGGLYKNSGPFTGMCSDFTLPHCHHHGPQGDDPYPAEGKPGCPSETSPKCPKKCDADASSDHSDFEDDKYSFVGRE